MLLPRNQRHLLRHLIRIHAAPGFCADANGAKCSRDGHLESEFRTSALLRLDGDAQRSERSTHDDHRVVPGLGSTIRNRPVASVTADPARAGEVWTTVTLALGTLAPPGSTTRPVISIADKTVMFRHSVRAVFAVSARTPRRRGGLRGGACAGVALGIASGRSKRRTTKCKTNPMSFSPPSPPPPASSSSASGRAGSLPHFRPTDVLLHRLGPPAVGRSANGMKPSVELRQYASERLPHPP